MTTADPLVKTLREAATREGFSLFGIAPAVPLPGYPNLLSWIDAGYAGNMDYFANRKAAYEHPRSVLEGARSIIALAYPYDAADTTPITAGMGKVARYVWSGIDYHDTIHPKMKQLCQILLTESPESHARGVVDTAPLMEREIAKQAGLGWTGKNTLLLNKQQGSYFFLACVLSDLELPYDPMHETDHCGTCRACLDACPTNAFPEPGVLDASRCISYLTIEHRDPIPLTLRDGIGEWLFGCDICQEVCPWNRKPAQRATHPETALDTLDLSQLFDLSDEQFRQRFRKTPLWRTRRKGVLRNAAIVLGNQQQMSGLPALIRGLKDKEGLVRGASAWALGKIGGDQANAALESSRDTERDPQVLGEIELALSMLNQ